LSSLLNQLSPMGKDESLACIFTRGNTINQLSEDDLEDNSAHARAR
jgi:hypothetical protein